MLSHLGCGSVVVRHFAPFVCGDFVFLFCNVVLRVLSSFTVIWMRKRDLALYLYCALAACGCESSVLVPYGVICWYVACDCGISWSYSLSFRSIEKRFQNFSLFFALDLIHHAR